MNPLVRLLTPDKRALQFTIKGFLAMALALYLAMLFGLERPYWALISAILLQLRPETGLVIEKGLCQIIGTLVGGAVGLLILTTLGHYPALALIALGAWIAINAGASAWARQANLIFGFAMAAITAILVVVLPVANPGLDSNQAVFDVANARISEIVLGAICASVVSALLWPGRVSLLLIGHSRDTLNHLLDYLALELSPLSTHAQRHEQADKLLQTTFTLNDDSTAANFEDSDGQGKARAATVVTNKVLSVLASSRTLGRLQRYHPDQITPRLQQLMSALHDRCSAMRDTTALRDAYQEAQSLRQDIKHLQQDDVVASPLEQRLLQNSLQMTNDLIVALNAHRALAGSRERLLRAVRFKAYRDPLHALMVGARATGVFALAALLWIGTASSSAVLIMVLPVLLTILFARLPDPKLALRKAAIGATIAIPTALFFTLPILAMATSDMVLLLMVFGGPLALGILAISHRETLHYGLGFCTPYILISQPGTVMNFHIEQGISNGMAVVFGLLAALITYHLVTTPDTRWIRRRLLRHIAHDLNTLRHRDGINVEEQFHSRMADRIRWLSLCDHALPNDSRHFTDLGLTALNLGQVSLWVQRQTANSHSAETMKQMTDWRHALADAWLDCTHKKTADTFIDTSRHLLRALYLDPALDSRTCDYIEGACRRLDLTFLRLSSRLQSE